MLHGYIVFTSALLHCQYETWSVASHLGFEFPRIDVTKSHVGD